MYLLPNPQELNYKDGNFLTSYNTRIVIDPRIRECNVIPASLLQKCITQWTGLTLAIIKGTPETGDIFLTLLPEYNDQGYQLTISEKNIFLDGKDYAGVLYGVQTLCQIVEQCGGILPCLEITDFPNLMHRGYYLDQTRGRVLKLENLKDRKSVV